MIRYIFYSLLVIGFPILLQKIFPADNEHGMGFTLGVFAMIFLWLIFGVYIFLNKKNKVSHFLYCAIVLFIFLFTYNIYPWYKEHTGYKIIKDCLEKKKVKNVDLQWEYTLEPNVENYTLIALAQKKSKTINADRKYNVLCYYYNKNSIQEYLKKSAIYFKDNLPYLIDSSFRLVHKVNNEYMLVDSVTASLKVMLSVKNGKFDLSSLGFKSYINQTEDIEIYSKEFEKYIYEIKKQNELNTFNVSKTYWVYKLI